MKRLTAKVSGKVHDVGYLDELMEIARSLSISVKVENLEDGGFKIIADGDEEKLIQFGNDIDEKSLGLSIEKAIEEYAIDFEKKNEIYRKLERLWNAIETARDCGYNMNSSHLIYKNNYQDVCENIENGHFFKAEDIIWDIKDDYFRNLRDANNKGIKKYLNFKANIYGIFPLIYSYIISVLCIILLFKYPISNIDSNPYIILFKFIKFPSAIIGIPIWAALFGGLGACAQNFYCLWWNVWNQGTVSDEYRYQCFMIPLMSPIFGYIAYILMDMGALALGGSVSDTSLSAGNEQIYGRILVCFLAGFATNKFLERLWKMIEKM